MTGEKQNLKGDALKNFKRVDEKRRQEWIDGLNKLKDELSQTASTYISDQRIIRAKIAELSYTRTLG